MRGYLVIGEAGSAGEAIDAIDSQPPDAVLLDVRLADASGGVVAAYLRVRYPAVSVLLVSADAADAAHHLDGGAAGAFGPVDKSELAKIDLSEYWPSPLGRDTLTPRRHGLGAGYQPAPRIFAFCTANSSSLSTPCS